MAKMSVSFKKGTTTNIKHNNRDFQEHEWKQKQHEHIIRARSDQNIIVVRKDIKEVYKEQFGDAVEEYNAKQTRSNRKIKDAYEHFKNSKKHHEQYEIVVGFGSKKDWDGMPFEEKAIAGHQLARWADNFQKRHKNLVVYNAVVHLDEAGAPHIHLNFVPVATGYQRSLKKQPSLSKALENEGYPGRGRDSREQWNEFRSIEVDSLTRYLNELGIERKTVGTNSIKDMHEYKEMIAEVNRTKEEKQQEINSLDNNIQEKQSLEEELENRINKGKQKRWELNEKFGKNLEEYEKALAEKKKIERALQIIKSQWDKLSLAQKAGLSKIEVELDNVMKREVGIEVERRTSQKSDIIKSQGAKLDKLKKELAEVKDANFRYEQESSRYDGIYANNIWLKKENDNLKKENKELKQELSFFKNQFRKFAKAVRKHLSNGLFFRQFLSAIDPRAAKWLDKKLNQKQSKQKDIPSEEKETQKFKNREESR
ncbi:plasmid recombination protein [Streptococcus pluranimalium]